MEHFKSTQAWLTSSFNIKVLPEWLKACLEWIAEENEGAALSLEAAKRQVYEQWLTSDLVEVGEASLPVEVQTSDQLELKSNHALQVISIVDVGFPLYGQQQKLMGKENANETVAADKVLQPGWEPKQSRMLLLTLTDGHTEIKAMERQPIRSLHTQVPCGSKCIISGPVLCRRGMALLSEEHFHLLGGEVDTLAETNIPLAILQQEMVKNRENEGKHARQDFSGKFLKHGSNKGAEWEKKVPFVKREAGLHHGQGNRAIQSTGDSIVKTEVKNEQGSEKPQNAEEEWGDDLDYNLLFDGDMDFDEGATHQDHRASPTPATAYGQEDESQIKKSKSTDFLYHGNPGSDASWSINENENDPDCGVVNNLKNPHGEKESVLQDDSIEGLFDDIEDLEMQDLIGDSKQLSVDKEVSTDVEGNPKLAIKASNDQSKPGPSIDAKSKQGVISKHGHQNYDNDSPQCFTNKLECRATSCSPTFTSLAQSAVQPAGLSKKNIPKNNSEDQHSTHTKSPANKRQKIQTKVSDLFRKQFQSTLEGAASSKEHKDLEISMASWSSSGDASADDASRSKSPNVIATAPVLVQSNARLSVYSHKDTSSTLTSSYRSHSSGAGQSTSHDAKELPHAVIESFRAENEKGSLSLEDATNNSLSDLDNPSCSSIIIKVSILTLIERLCSNHGSHWSLACKVTDGTNTIDVDISNEVLTELIGFSAEDSIAMRQRFKIEPAVKQVFTQGLSQCQGKLISGRHGCLIEIAPATHMSSGNTNRPMIRRLAHLQSQLSVS